MAFSPSTDDSHHTFPLGSGPREPVFVSLFHRSGRWKDRNIKKTDRHTAMQTGHGVCCLRPVCDQSRRYTLMGLVDYYISLTVEVVYSGFPTWQQGSCISTGWLNFSQICLQTDIFDKPCHVTLCSLSVCHSLLFPSLVLL